MQRRGLVSEATEQEEGPVLLSNEAIIESFGHGKALDDGFGGAGFESADFEAKAIFWCRQQFIKSMDLITAKQLQQTNEMQRHQGCCRCLERA
jgi:hypothetical protein